MDFKNKTAVITGAAVGIGRAVALQLAQRGANVVLVDYNPDSLRETEREVREITGNVIAITCDVSDNAKVLETVQTTVARFGKIDILVNNAALWRCWSSLEETPIHEWKQYIDVNVMGTVYFTKAVISQMIAGGFGRIINVSSVAGVYGKANMVHYSTTKGAVIAFTKALAKEVAGDGVTVNAVSPGSVSPSEERNIDYYEQSDLAFMGRTGTNRENADLICFLASEKAGYISGQNIQIDGCRMKL